MKKNKRKLSKYLSLIHTMYFNLILMRLAFTQLIAIVTYSFTVHLDSITVLKRMAIRSQDKQDWGEPSKGGFPSLYPCFSSISTV